MSRQAAGFIPLCVRLQERALSLPPALPPRPVASILPSGARPVRVYDPSRFHTQALTFRAVGPASRLDHHGLNVRGAHGNEDCVALFERAAHALIRDPGAVRRLADPALDWLIEDIPLRHNLLVA